MAKPKFDGVVVAVRYGPDGRVDWVRAYQRRGPTWSDHRMVSRQELIDALKAGQRYVVGRRLPLLASTFETSEPVQLVEQNSQLALVSGRSAPGSSGDQLDGVPRV